MAHGCRDLVVLSLYVAENKRFTNKLYVIDM
jgi:hypothetical protein